jgi:ATP-dependent protease ClpP protease subunit
MAKKAKYYQLCVSDDAAVADLDIYGDITEYDWFGGDVSAYSIVTELNALPASIETINVRINSYGGEVKEGLAIVNALKRHNAKIVTMVDGMACSAAAGIFMAGDERIMADSSLLMIHNAWTWANGNPDQLRKAAEDLDAINDATINLYTSKINISEQELREMLDNETWLLPEDALEMGFATKIVDWSDGDHPSQSARKSIYDMVKASRQSAAKAQQADVIDLAKQPLTATASFKIGGEKASYINDRLQQVIAQHIDDAVEQVVAQPTPAQLLANVLSNLNK